MAIILSLETTSDVCSVALSNNGQLTDIIEEHDTRDHASKLTVLIQDLLSRNSTSIKALDAIAISQGPGSYTGLRIGVSTAKGICYGANKPLLAIDTLQMLCQQATEADKDTEAFYCPLIDARRMEVYTALFNYQLELKEPVNAKVLNPDFLQEERENHKIYFFGSGTDKAKNIITGKNTIFIDDIKPSAASMVKLAEEKFQQKGFSDVAYFEPLYLKSFIATVPRKKIL